MKRVLLIGDSIRLHYQNEVKRLIGDEYEIVAPQENCRFSSYVLNSLRYWLAECPNSDIIHWNAGLWDIAVLYKEDGCFTPVEEYVLNMQKILRELKKTGAKIIYATTTPVLDEKKYLAGPIPPAHDNEDIIRYNRAVLEAFKEEAIVINDLHKIMYQEKDRLLSEDMIHPNEEGIKRLGAAVASMIKAQQFEKEYHAAAQEISYAKPDEKMVQ